MSDLIKDFRFLKAIEKASPKSPEEKIIKLQLRKTGHRCTSAYINSWMFMCNTPVSVRLTRNLSCLPQSQGASIYIVPKLDRNRSHPQAMKNVTIES